MTNQAEKLVLTTFASGHDQGTYGLVVGIGRLLRGTLIFPIETGAFGAFSRAASVSSSSSETDHSKATAMRIDAFALLLRSLRIAISVWIVVVAVIPYLSTSIIQVLYGDKWAHETEAPVVFSWYTCSLALMTVCGLTESFMHANASSSELAAANTIMLVISASSTCLSVWAVQRVGAVGIVACTCVNEMLRYESCPDAMTMTISITSREFE